MVTLGGCTSPISNKVWVVVTGVEELTHGQVSVYPVPNEGRFTVEITSVTPETFSIQVFDQVGRMIYEEKGFQVNGTVEKLVDLKPVTPGVYTMMVTGSTLKVVKKVLIR